MTLTEPMATVLVGVFAALAGVVTYACTEHSKLKQEDYVRREERYRLLITNAAGFRVDRENAPQKESFLRELDQCWLYCPDEVIMAAYAFLTLLGLVAAHPLLSEMWRMVDSCWQSGAISSHVAESRPRSFSPPTTSCFAQRRSLARNPTRKCQEEN
jgi:Pyruvate/2-oxoacid:ferredoxin oxidoreductase delta subunit